MSRVVYSECRIRLGEFSGQIGRYEDVLVQSRKYMRTRRTMSKMMFWFL